MTFDIAPASAERPQWQKLTLEAGVTTPIELQLLPGCILRGRVTDQDTGKPIAGARIGEGWTMDKYVETDADGRYEMRGYGSYGYGEVRVTAPDYGPQLRRLPKQADGVTADFALQRGCEVTGRTVDAAGKPVAGAYVAAVGFSGDGTFDWSGSTTDADGRYRLRGLRHEVEHALIARADGFASLVGDLPSLRPEPTALPDVTLRPARYVSGVVVDAEGKPVAGVQVWLRGNNADRAQLLGGADGGDTHGADYCIAVREMKTDSLGRIHFADVAPGSYQLLQRDGQSEQLRAVEVLAERDPEPTRLER
jgi:protocatechuate 3,4-dioxygenase beta subunit